MRESCCWGWHINESRFVIHCWNARAVHLLPHWYPTIKIYTLERAHSFDHTHPMQYSCTLSTLKLIKNKPPSEHTNNFRPALASYPEPNRPSRADGAPAQRRCRGWVASWGSSTWSRCWRPRRCSWPAACPWRTASCTLLRFFCRFSAASHILSEQQFLLKQKRGRCVGDAVSTLAHPLKCNASRSLEHAIVFISPESDSVLCSGTRRRSRNSALAGWSTDSLARPLPPFHRPARGERPTLKGPDCSDFSLSGLISYAYRNSFRLLQWAFFGLNLCVAWSHILARVENLLSFFNFCNVKKCRLFSGSKIVLLNLEPHQFKK